MQPLHHLFAPVRRASEFRPQVTSLVLFGLNTADGGVVYLTIRYSDYKNDLIEGDHLMLSLDEAQAYAQDEYGIAPNDWQPLSAVEIKKVDAGIG